MSGQHEMALCKQYLRHMSMNAETTRNRLPLLFLGASLAAGALACLGYLLWPSPTPAAPEGSADRPVPARLSAAKTQVDGNPAGKGTPRGMEKVLRPGGPPTVSNRGAGERMAPPHKVMTPPPATAENMIHGPVPWRRQGPPVKTPAPGQAGGKVPPVTVPGRLASPDGTQRNVQGQSLPYLLPARRNGTSVPANANPKGN